MIEVMNASAGVCVADDGLINPSMFPLRSADLDTAQITGSASKVTAIGTDVLASAEDAQTAWNGLQAPGVFQTPDSEAVYALMQPATEHATTMDGVTTRLGTALTTYAESLDGIKPTLSEFEERAAVFRVEALAGYEVTNLEAQGAFAFYGYYQAGPYGQAELAGTSMDPSGVTTIPWTEHEPAVTKNDDLLAEYNQIIESVSAAATTCANSIQAELTMVCVAPAETITAEMLDANPDLSIWGQSVTEDRNCSESVGHGLGSFWHGTWTGAASLIGRDPVTGEWSGGTAGSSWLGVGDFLLSTVIVLVPGSPFLALTPGPVGDFMEDRVNTVATSWGGLIGWDQQAHLAGENGWHKWEEDGVAALTESVANVGTFFIPGAGWAGGVGKTAIAGTRVGGIALRTAGIASDLIVPGGSHLLKGAVRVVEFSADGLRGHWGPLNHALTLTSPRPSGVPGLVNSALTNEFPLPARTPVSESLGLEPPSAHSGGPASAPQGSSAAHGENTLPGESAAPSGENSGAPEPSKGGSSGDSQHSNNRALYDPDEPPRNTVKQSEAPYKYADSDVTDAFERAPVDENGHPVDHRTGEPLRADTDGRREWYMKWDPDNAEWVAENPGPGSHDPGYISPRVSDSAWNDYQNALKHDPDAPPPYGYDANGDRLPYANHRPRVEAETVRETWWGAVKEQIIDKMQDEILVRDINGSEVVVRWDENSAYRSLLDDYQSGKITESQFRDGFLNDPNTLPTRNNIWDMGHTKNAKYSKLLDQYLRHHIDLDEFKRQFNDSNNYQVEDALRNRSHADEAGPDLDGPEF